MLKKMWTFMLALGVLLLSALPAAAQSPDKTIIETLSAEGSFESLLDAIAEADLNDTLEGDGPFTLFAPTDDAFEKLSDDFLEDEDKLKAVLTYHLLEGELLADEFTTETVDTLQGDTLPIKVSDDQILIDKARVSEADIEAANGVIHAIDTVLIPPSISTSVSGVPDSSDKNIIEILEEQDRFSEMVEAITKAGLDETLQEDGPFTVFALANDAFEKIPAEVREDQEKLSQVLTYHLLENETLHEDLKDETSVPSMQGETITIEVSDSDDDDDDDDDDEVRLNKTRQVIESDIQATNGVVHVVDTVLGPSAVFNSLEDLTSDTPTPTASPPADDEPTPTSTPEPPASEEESTPEPPASEEGSAVSTPTPEAPSSMPGSGADNSMDNWSILMIAIGLFFVGGGHLLRRRVSRA